MLYWALVFLIVAIIAGVLGFAGVATAAAGIAKILFFVFLVLFLVSLALAVVVSFGFRFLYNSAAFWITDVRGVTTLALTVSLFFSGMVLPLTFFPSWLRAIAHALPFASIVQTPIDVWLGKHHGSSLVGILAL